VSRNVFLKAGYGHGHLVRQGSFLRARELPQAEQAAHAITGFLELPFEPSMLFALRSREAAKRLTQHIAQVEEEHIKHLLKTSRSNVAVRRTKGKHYFRLVFAYNPPRTHRREPDSDSIGRAGWLKKARC